MYWHVCVCVCMCMCVCVFMYTVAYTQQAPAHTNTCIHRPHRCIFTHICTFAYDIQYTVHICMHKHIQCRNTNLCGCACYIVCVETYDSFGQWTSSSMSAAVLSLLCDICRDVSIGRHPIGKREVWLMDQ